MALIREPMKRAQSIGDGQLSKAAQLHASLEAELALNDELDPAWESNAQNALDDLEARFGGADRLRDTSVDRGHPAPSLSRGAQRGQDAPHGGRRRSAPTSGDRGRGRGAAPSGGRGRAGGRSSSRSGSSRALRGSYRTARMLAEPATSSATDLLISSARIMLGLALLYLILSPRGSKGFARILRSSEAIVSAFLRPVDPIGRGAVSGELARQQRTRQVTRGARTAGAGPAAPAIGALGGVPVVGSVTSFLVPGTNVTINRPPNAPAPGGARPT